MTIPKIFKSSKRFSERKRPTIGCQAFFSPTITLTTTELVPDRSFKELLDRPYVVSNAPVEVAGLRKSVAEVRFQASSEVDLVPFDWLEEREMTEFGRALMSMESKLSPQTRKLLCIGER